MNTFKHFGEFWKRVGLLRDYEYFEDVDIEPSDMVGIFGKRQERELVEFCYSNPEFHIVSMPYPGLYLNGYTPKGIIYFLADGDRNPKLFYRIGPADYAITGR